jgi:hypothetical protein
VSNYTGAKVSNALKNGVVNQIYFEVRHKKSSSLELLL